MKKLQLIFFSLIISYSLALAQEGVGKSVLEENNRHQIGAMLGHTFMKTKEFDESSKRLTVPSITIFYNYHFNKKWFLGLHTDFVTENFVAETIIGGENSLEREKPVAPAIMAGYKLGKHVTFLLGGGIDVDKEESLGLIRFDTEYGLEIKDGWEFVTAFGYDFRFNAYDSFQLGVGIAKSF